ncbi:MAG: hypothetical protein HC769_31030 [Cyanobacteria bacterium CRU_2_1]|nr:hypothetical protein [Cyanobacteria bacterium CRU_2_1]
MCPQDQRHLQGFCENVAAILQAQSACLSHWLPYLSHRDCQARSHMERLNYFVHNFKDYKSAAFELIRSHLRDASALTCLLMLLAAATLIAIAIAVGVVIHQGQRKILDWHNQRGLSFLQLGLREIERLCDQHLPILSLATLPRKSPPPATASLQKRAQLETRIEFSRVTVFST